jgi:flagellar biosynthesis protein FlhF
MRLKLYRAPTMTVAMAQMRAELGPDALILSTRSLRDGVELTAGLDRGDTAAPPLVAQAMALAERPAVVGRPPAWPAARRARPPVHDIMAYHGVLDPLAQRITGASLAGELMRLLRFAPILLEAGPLLLVGPPGAGKTSTTARLATRLVLAGQRPMVVSADGNRAGATEQLASYTRLLGLDLVVAPSSAALARALGRRQPGAAVLIDAAGADCRDPAQMHDLAALAAVARGRQALVLQAGLEPREAAEIASAHAEAGATLLVATKLDLARRLGSVLAAADVGGLALAEAGIGPGAADGLVPLTAALLAERLQQHLNGASQAAPFLSEARV